MKHLKSMKQLKPVEFLNENRSEKLYSMVDDHEFNKKLRLHDLVDFTNNEMGEIIEFLPGGDVELNKWVLSSHEKSSMRILIDYFYLRRSVEIVKLDDEWFLISYHGPSQSHFPRLGYTHDGRTVSRYYVCDSFEGLMSFLHEVAYSNVPLEKLKEYKNKRN